MIRGGGVCGCLRGESWRGLDVWALREPTSVSTGGSLYAAAELTTSVSTGSGFRRRSIREPTEVGGVSPAGGPGVYVVCLTARNTDTNFRQGRVVFFTALRETAVKNLHPFLLD